MHSAEAINVFCQNSLESLILISSLIPLDLPNQSYEHLNAISSESEPRVETIKTCISKVNQLVKFTGNYIVATPIANTFSNS